MKIIHWTIKITLENGHEEYLSDIPDWVAKNVDEYLNEKEEYSKSKKEEDRIKLQEDNKLIAEFMDMKVSTDGTQVKDENWFYVDLDSTFNTSWDWLMPVVERIEEIERIGVHIEGTYVSIKTDESGKDVEIVRGKTTFSKLESTYNAVVEFIKQYNK